MKEYQKHIKSTFKDKEFMSICGEVLNYGEFVFEDIDHAFYTILMKGRLQCCPKCQKEILEVFRDE